MVVEVVEGPVVVDLLHLVITALAAVEVEVEDTEEVDSVVEVEVEVEQVTEVVLSTVQDTVEEVTVVAGGKWPQLCKNHPTRTSFLFPSPMPLMSFHPR